MPVERGLATWLRPAFHLIAIGVAVGIDLPAALYIHEAPLKIVVMAFGIGLAVFLAVLNEILSIYGRSQDRIRQVVGLSEALWRDTGLRALVISLVDSWRRSLERKDPLLKRHATQVLQEAARKMAQLGDGKYTVTAHDDDQFVRELISRLDATRRRLQATSLVSAEFWRSPLGRAWWEANKAFLRKGRGLGAGLRRSKREIERIFLVDDPQAISAEDKEIMIEQALEGVKVRVAIGSGQELEFDFGIFDDRFVCHMTFSPRGRLEIRGFEHFGPDTNELDVFRSRWRDDLDKRATVPDWLEQELRQRAEKVGQES